MSIYTEEQNNWNFDENIIENFWNRARNQFIEKELARQPEIKQGRVLDVGCGVGIVGKYLNKKGYDCWGCEPSNLKYNLLEEKLFNCEFDLLEENFKKTINTVILADVIEHIADDRQFINNIITQLPNCQYILITVPANRILWHENDVVAGHYRRYNKHQLRQLIANLSTRNDQLVSVKMRSLFFSLSLAVLLSKIIKKTVLFKTRTNVNKNSIVDTIF